MKLFYTVAFTLLSTVCFSAAAVSEHTETLHRGQWPIYEIGTDVIALPQIRKILFQYEEDEKTSIEIRYPGGDAGRLWAESLTDWLVSYGVPAKYIDLFAGSGAADRLVIAFIDRR